MARELSCPNGCAGALFEALNAPLYVDAAGRYVRHDDAAAAYRCPVCGSIALDVAAAAREMSSAAEPEAEEVLACPSCGTLMLPPEDDPGAGALECPTCGAQFTPEEGMPRLHGGGWMSAAGGDGEV